MYCFSYKRLEELCVMTLKGAAKFKQKLSCGLKNDIRNLVNFMRAVESPKIGTLIGSVCPKYANI